MKTLPVEIESFELRILNAEAGKQFRSPENLARFFICKGLGLVIDDGPSPKKNTRYDAKTLAEHNVVAGAGINP